MRDFKQEIDGCDDPNQLRVILSELAALIDELEAAPYEETSFEERIHAHELIRQYGELKLAKLLA